MDERVKRVLDVIGALVGLGICLPLLPVLAIAIKLDSPGPVFFWQHRMGRYGRPFKMLKLRSMVDGAEQMQHEVAHLNEANGPAFKITNDPRTTRIGRFLRVTSLDEVPQFFNVLKGDMSLVGPRPLPLDQVDLTVPEQRRRLEALPGLTGLWQINGRSYLNYEEWMAVDLQYVATQNLGLDLWILIQTVPAVLSGNGAC